MVRRLLVILLLALLPATAWAQRGMLEPLEVAELTADCLTRHWVQDITRPAWVEELDRGYRVVVPLRGQPERQDVQFRPPTEDTLAWFDLYRYDDFTRAPPGVRYLTGEGKEPYDRYAMRVGNRAYVVYADGYDWYTLRSQGADCLAAALGAP
jgi:hypothetical protein